MNVVLQIFLGIVGLVLSYSLVKHTQKIAEYTKGLAHSTKDYTEETRNLWEVTKKSYFVNAITDYLSGKYGGCIEKWPPDRDAWMTWPPPKEEQPKKFRSECYKAVLEELFPEVEEMEKTVMEKLVKKGFEFKEK